MRQALLTPLARLTHPRRGITGLTLQPELKPREIALARFDADGKLDATFGGTGTVTLASDGSDEVGAVVVQPDGKVVVAGSRSTSGSFEIVVTRFTAGGAPDMSWAGDARAFPDFESQSFATAAALQPDGKLVVVGMDAAEVDMAAVRFRSDGSLDPSFGSGGRSTIPGGFIEAASAVALQPDGRVVMAGQSIGGAPVVRLLADPPPADGGTPGGGPSGTPGGGPSSEPGPGVTPSVPRCAGRRATIVGSARGETLRGTPRADVIVARGGNNRVRAGGGRDVVCGGAGRDALFGGAGRDVLAGGAGRDRLVGGERRDSCSGGPGHDRAAGCEARHGL